MGSNGYHSHWLSDNRLSGEIRHICGSLDGEDHLNRETASAILEAELQRHIDNCQRLRLARTQSAHVSDPLELLLHERILQSPSRPIHSPRFARPNDASLPASPHSPNDPLHEATKPIHDLWESLTVIQNKRTSLPSTSFVITRRFPPTVTSARTMSSTKLAFIFVKHRRIYRQLV